MRTVTDVELAENLDALVAEVENSDEEILITRDGNPIAVLKVHPAARAKRRRGSSGEAQEAAHD